MGKILPQTTPVSEPYWQGCREGKLLLQQCDACAAFQFYPRVLCSRCGHGELHWREATGRGRVASFTVVRKPVSSDYPAPSIIALIDLEEGPRMMSSLINVEPEEVAVNAAVTVDFQDWSEDIAMPVFRLSMEEAES
jgi:uncharacterized OB-fold protein